ncbi:hypothetical protein MP228_000478 [Amoeboaphelidium protococcarum]|nr:hypothetical protein MP228_000478 [Amoeboaphelidium protococcarum]
MENINSNCHQLYPANARPSACDINALLNDENSCETKQPLPILDIPHNPSLNEQSYDPVEAWLNNQRHSPPLSPAILSEFAPQLGFDVTTQLLDPRVIVSPPLFYLPFNSEPNLFPFRPNASLKSKRAFDEEDEVDGDTEGKENKLPNLQTPFKKVCGDNARCQVMLPPLRMDILNGDGAVKSKLFKCSQCLVPNYFNSQVEYSSHMIKVHSKDGYKCPNCHKHIKTWDGFKKHQRKTLANGYCQSVGRPSRAGLHSPRK